MTLAVLENFGVWIRLSEREEVLAARIVELIRERGRYAEQEVPLVIASQREQHRIITALRIALVVDVRNEDGIAWLYIGSLAPASLAPELGSSYGYHNIPRVQRRPVLENENTLPRSQHQLPGGDRDDL
jgi:hypothetical protein